METCTKKNSQKILALIDAKYRGNGSLNSQMGDLLVSRSGDGGATPVIFLFRFVYDVKFNAEELPWFDSETFLTLG